MSSRKKWTMIVYITFVSAILVAWFSYNGGTYTTVITQEEAQMRIDQALETEIAKERSIIIRSLKVWFKDNQIKVSADVSGKFHGHRTLHSTIESMGTIDYQVGSFYFTPTEQIKFSNIRVEMTDSEKKNFPKTKGLLKKRVDQFISKYGLDEITRTFRVEFEEWATGVVQRQIVNAFSNNPLYTLKGTKGFLIGSVLERVEVVEGKLHITYSAIKLGYSIILALGLFILVVCIGLFFEVIVR